MKKTLTILFSVLVLGALLALPALAETPYVAYWSFDENGTEAYNGYAPDNPEALTLVTGKVGKAYGGAGPEGDGAGILYYDGVDMPLTSNFTVACWANGDAMTEAGSFYVWWAKNEKATNGHYEYYWFPDGTFGCYGTNTDYVCNVRTAWPYDDGEWHHYCIRAERLEDGVEYKCYIDGEYETSYTGSSLKTAAGTMSIGGLVDGTLPAQTYVDELIFTNVLIPEEDIAKLMEDTKGYAETLHASDVTIEAEPEAAPAEFATELFAAYWSFDGDGKEAVNGFEPSNPEALTLAEGKNGQAYDGGEVIYYDNVNLKMTTSATVSCWAKGLDPKDTYYVFWAKNEKSTTGHLEFYWFPDGAFGCYGTNTGDTTVNLNSEAVLNDGGWHHFAVRMYDGVYQLFVDGEFVKEYAGSSMKEAEGTLAIGGLIDGSLASATMVDDLFMTNCYLSADEIKSLMNDTAAFKDALVAAGQITFADDAAAAPEPEPEPEEEEEPADPFVAYWSFDADAAETFGGYAPRNPEALNLVEGKSGSAYGGAGMDGSGILYYDDIELALTKDFTTSCWVKGDFDTENGGYFVVMAKNDKGTNGHYEMYWFPDGKFGVYGTNADTAVNLTSTGVLDNAEWHHYCVRAEGAEYKLYVDGVYDGTYSGVGLKRAAGTLSFGGLGDGSLPSQSAVDEVFFANTLIPEEDVAKLMEDTKAYAYQLAGQEMPAEAEPEAEPEAGSVDEKLDQKAEAPNTFDFGVIAAVAAVVSLCGFSLSGKKR